MRRRIEPTLPDPLAPSSGRVRLRIRFNADYAVGITEQDAALHGVSTSDLWADAHRDDASREMVVDVAMPQFAEPAQSPIAADPPPIPPPAAASPPIPEPSSADPVPTPVRTMQPMLSPMEHAERLLAWCHSRGLVGEVIIFDIERAYAAMCAEAGIQPRPWNPVSRELTVLVTGKVGKKSYRMLGGEKRRVFCIPPAQASEAMRAAA